MPRPPELQKLPALRNGVFQHAGDSRKTPAKVLSDGVSWQTKVSPKRERRSHWRLSPEESNYSPLRMAEQCQVSLRHLERRFKLEIGSPPRVWLKWQRLKAALVYLQGTARIKEIAYSLHYCQVSHFCRDFKLHFKMTPSEIRRLPRSVQERLLALDAPFRRQPSSRDSRFVLAGERKTR
jgi:AraC-like DNA-binding protein